MLQWYNHEMDTTNIILHWIAHFRGQVTKIETRPRPMLETKAEAEALTSLLRT